MKNSKIGWTSSTVNFWIGCHKVSTGCQNCYAETLVRRWGGDFSKLRRTADNTFYAALKWKDSRKIFTCSLSDFFHPDSDKWREDAWDVIRKTPQHTWQILTKRPERIKECLPEDWKDGYKNVWLGVSVEMHHFYNRIRKLVEIPASVHFISCEPLLGPLSEMPLNHIEWIIVGGESGHNFREMKEKWVREILEQCRRNDVAFFYKQPSGIRNEMPAIIDGNEIKEYPTEKVMIL